MLCFSAAGGVDVDVDVDGESSVAAPLVLGELLGAPAAAAAIEEVPPGEIRPP